MKNIVWLASYPKSGNTWFRMFLANYEQNAEKPLPLENIESPPIASSSVDFEEQTGLNPFELYPDEVGYLPSGHVPGLVGENSKKGRKLLQESS